MAKVKMVEDPTDGGGRGTVNGPMPAPEKGPVERVDEQREIVTQFGVDDYGTPYVRTHRERVPDGNAPVHHMGAVPKRPIDYIHDKAKEREELLALARQEVIPAISFYKDLAICAWSGKDGRWGPPDVTVPCVAHCPSLSDGKCAENRMRQRPQLVKVVQAKDFAEYEKLIAEPGASVAADYQQQLEAVVGRIAGERAAAKKAAAEQQEADRVEARRKMLEERRKVHFDYIENPDDLAAARAAAQGRVNR